jgi:hypothetical protein
MSFANYGTFRTAVGTQLARPELAGTAGNLKVIDAISLAEARMNRNLGALGAGELASTALTTNAELMDLPTDFNGMRLLALQTSVSTPLDFMTPEILLTRYPSTAVGLPRAYTIHGKDGVSDVMQARFRAIPDGTYSLLAFYYKKVATLVGGSDAGTNWMLTNNPDAYLYSTCLELAIQIQDDQQVVKYQTAYGKAMDDIKALDKQRRWSNISPRSAPAVNMIRGM